MDEIGAGNYLIMYDPNELNSMARELYTIYCRAVGGIAFNGEPLPAWDEFAADKTKAKQVNAWRAVAQHALDMNIDGGGIF